MPREQQRGQHAHHGVGKRKEKPDINLLLDKVKIKQNGNEPLDPELFSEIAEALAKSIGKERDAPKPTQIRKFFDELVMWEERVWQDKNRFAEYLPIIRMLNAKAAYAKGRKHVTENFVQLMTHCLKQVGEPESLSNFKLFFEAFLGFYKLYGRDK